MESIARPKHKLILLTTLIGLTLISLAAVSVWKITQRHRYSEMMKAYFAGAAGDRASIEKLATDGDARSKGLLDRILLNEATEDRLLVARIMKKHNMLDTRVVAELLNLQRPHTDRHLGFLIFQEFGCDNYCVLAAAAELEQLRAGVKTPEDLKFAEFPNDTYSELADGQTKKEAETLLVSNPCSSMQALKFTSSASDLVIAQQISRELQLEQKCVATIPPR